MADFHELQDRYRRFTTERDWAQFHDPKSLILALTGEVGELAELFQWVPAGEAKAIFEATDRKQRAAEEMSDVLIYLIALAQALDIDLVRAAHEKLSAAEDRFPVKEFSSRAPFKE